MNIRCDYLGCENKAIGSTAKQFGNYMVNVNTCENHWDELRHTWARYDPVEARLYELIGEIGNWKAKEKLK